VEPAVIARSEHGVSRANISENALKVLYRLHKAGYRACLVGGSVRDLLLGREPKDFDVATDASPEDIKQLFRNCRLIGRRFRLAHIHFGPEIIEVATFRGGHENGAIALSDSGRILSDNVYGTIEDDALRRDFTVNALYYDIADFSVIDYVGGLEDLRGGVLRLIGDPATRFREDPVRMLRAVRFAAKLGFRIDAEAERLIHELAEMLEEIPPARLFDEVIKLFHSGHAVASFELLRHYDLFRRLAPDTEEALASEDHAFPRVFIARALANTDERIAEGKPVTPAFLFAALLWEPARILAERLAASEALSPVAAMQRAGAELVGRQVAHIAIPRRFSLPMREVWALQLRLERRSGKTPLRLLGHPQFRAAYDFLCLRSEVGEVDAELCRWWTEFQQANEEARHGMTRSGQPSGRRRRGRRRRRRPVT
jgi:poly(A) polymerase